MLPIDLGHNDSFLNFLLYMYNTKISNGNNSLQKKKRMRIKTTKQQNILELK